jgi:hypothetical protein
MHLSHPSRIFCIATLLILATGGSTFADFGPLQTSNRFPLHLLFLKPRPVPAQLPSRGDMESTLALEYSNTFFDYQNSRWNVLMDMEMLVADLSLVYGLTSKMAVRLDLPFVSMDGGFLDGFLENFHDAIGTSNYGREKRPKNTFEYRVTKDGRLWVQGDDGSVQMADVTVSTQIELFKLRNSPKMAGSLLLSLKLPTGDSTRGLGSGQFDAGVYLPMQWSADQWSFFAMPGVAFIGDPDTQGAGIAACNSFSLFGGVAYDYSQNTTWLVQLNYYTSPLEETGLNALDKGALELDIGFHHRLAEHWLIEFAFCEDLTLALPDFNVRLGLRWTFTL